MYATTKKAAMNETDKTIKTIPIILFTVAHLIYQIIQQIDFEIKY